jgi:quaternary ammonium compound-resistance protein SugE
LSDAGRTYAVWTGIGAARTAILGMAVLGESPALLRILCIVLILTGVIGLKLVSGSRGQLLVDGPFRH